MIKFDHIEVHVNNIEKYIVFLKSIFGGGESKKLTDDGISMFKSPDGLFIEIKKKEKNNFPTITGFCQPCLMRKDAKQFIQNMGFEIAQEADTAKGKVYFFKDHEDIMWHLKDYEERDWTSNW